MQPEWVLNTTSSLSSWQYAFITLQFLPHFLELLGTFHLVKISLIFGSAVNGTRFVGSSHWKIPGKSGKSENKVGPFFRLEFPKECRVPFTFLVVCTSSWGPRSGTATYRALRPNGTTFYQSEIPLLLPPKFPVFFPKWKAPLVTLRPT